MFFWLQGKWGLKSLTRDRTCTPCIGRQRLNHWIPREVPQVTVFYPGKNTGVSCHSLSQGMFLAQGSIPGLLHCRRNLYSLGHQGDCEVWMWLISLVWSEQACS